MTDVVVIGAGPAGLVAALRAAYLGAKTVLVARDEFGGMAANNGPVPVRALAHAARLIRDARQLGQYGITVGEPTLDYNRLLTRVREIVGDVCAHSSFREQLHSQGVAIQEHAGAARFVDAHTIATASGLHFESDKFIISTGGVSRKLPIPGFELTGTHSDAWRLTSVPPSMLVVGAGATGAQVASVFNAFGSRIHLFEAAPRILMTEDQDIAAAVKSAFQASGINVQENFGTIDSFEKTPSGVKMNYSKDGKRDSVEAALAIVAVGWGADTTGLNLAAVGVQMTPRGFVKVDEYLRTSAPNIFAAGDITGRMMLVPQALQDGFAAATNAVRGPTMSLAAQVAPTGSFTEPEYAQVGLSETKARETHDIVTAVVPFASTTRTIIDGRTFGFCKLIVDRKTCQMLGCHVVGERAVDIVQIAAVAMAANMRVDDFARIPLSYPTYAGVFVHAAASAASQLNLTVWQPHCGVVSSSQSAAAQPAAVMASHA
jgi:dihydrolipoamide dehydrogenase